MHGRWPVAAALFAIMMLPHAGQAQSGEGRGIATFAGGCFWCVEEVFDAVDGVISTTSGYIGGHVADPTYRQVVGGNTGHTEAVEVIYDPAQVSYQELLDVFWRNVDPLDGGGQFCDRGSSYRSGIFTHDEEQTRLAEESKAEVAKLLGLPVATEVTSASEFYVAEDYHQGYYARNPIQYTFYKTACGRAARLYALWGDPSS